MKKRIKAWQIIVAAPIVLFAVIMISSSFSLISDGEVGNGILGVVFGFLCIASAAVVIVVPLIVKRQPKDESKTNDSAIQNDSVYVSEPVMDQSFICSDSQVSKRSEQNEPDNAVVAEVQERSNPKENTEMEQERRFETKFLSFDILNVRDKNAYGTQRQTVLHRCYERQEKGTYEDDGANFNSYKTPNGWTYAVLINGVKIGDTSQEDAQELSDLVQSGWKISCSSNSFDVSVDEKTGDCFYTCHIMITLQKPISHEEA